MKLILGNCKVAFLDENNLTKLVKEICEDLIFRTLSVCSPSLAEKLAKKKKKWVSNKCLLSSEK